MAGSDDSHNSPITGNIEDINYTDEEIEDWIKRDKDFVKLSEWNAYILARRQSYFFERQKVLGPEYYNNTSQWDSILDREWRVMEERLNSGIGLDEDIIAEFGEDFFAAKDNLFKDMEDMADSFDSEYVGDSEKLIIYTFEDFLMLSNQGIFRDHIFILDPQRKWRKKVEDVVTSYGYTNIERIQIKGVNYLVVSKETY
jgi:hypothetical protein|tara:strand:- start:4300 stop:4896 length:597 start_codon:yes stop_codon:yes gene_type:complete